jgi:hypothetical protein
MMKLAFVAVAVLIEISAGLIKMLLALMDILLLFGTGWDYASFVNNSP